MKRKKLETLISFSRHIFAAWTDGLKYVLQDKPTTWYLQQFYIDADTMPEAKKRMNILRKKVLRIYDNEKRKDDTK